MATLPRRAGVGLPKAVRGGMIPTRQMPRGRPPADDLLSRERQPPPCASPKRSKIRFRYLTVDREPRPRIALLIDVYPAYSLFSFSGSPNRGISRSRFRHPAAATRRILGNHCRIAQNRPRESPGRGGLKPECSPFCRLSALFRGNSEHQLAPASAYPAPLLSGVRLTASCAHEMATSGRSLHLREPLGPRL